jgi:hypothetical protein
MLARVRTHGAHPLHWSETEGEIKREKEGGRETERERERGREGDRERKKGEKEADFLCLQGCSHPSSLVIEEER